MYRFTSGVTVTISSQIMEGLVFSKDSRPVEGVDFDKNTCFTTSQDVDIPAKHRFQSSTSLKSFRDARAFGFKRKFFWNKFSCRVKDKVKVCFRLYFCYVHYVHLYVSLTLFIAVVSPKFSGNITCP